jgi:hypothetical protein
VAGGQASLPGKPLCGRAGECVLRGSGRVVLARGWAAGGDGDAVMSRIWGVAEDAAGGWSQGARRGCGVYVGQVVIAPPYS